MNKQDFKKINDYLWEIPKSFRSDMRVPARAYVSEKMLEESFKDRSLEQLVNIATLPGIQKYALAMPDMHEGYASCIGGVAAIRTSDGVISPGVCGYDINCLDGDTKILHSLGYHLSIKEFENKNVGNIKCGKFKEKKIEETSILLFLKRKTNPSIFKITTKIGEEIKATSDHPFFTPKGMIPLGKLKRGDKIALYCVEGVPYEEPSNEEIISEKDIRKTLLKLGRKPGEVRFDQNLRALKKRDLLNLTYDHPKIPYILKIIGFIFGDGSTNFIGRKKDGITYFIGQPEDLEEIRNDIREIGYTPSPIHFRKRKIKNKTKEEYSFVVNAASLVILLKTLGEPLGNKVFQAYRVPKWIYKSPFWQKRLFLAALFGAELRTPHRRLERKFGFNCPVFPMNKGESFIENGKIFLKDLSRLLKEFGIKTSTINCRRRHINRKGQSSFKLELVFSPQIESLLNLWGKIGYEYNKKRQTKAAIAVAYLKYKQKVLKERIQAAEMARNLRKEKMSYKEIYKKLCGPFISPRFLQDVIWKGDRKKTIVISPHFPPLKEFIKQSMRGLGKSGMIWDEITKIEEIPYKNWVYDFTVNHPDHNFIANNFVVSNCGMKLLKSDLLEKDIKPYIEKLAIEIQKEVPSGLGKGRQIKLSIEQIDKILEGGVPYLVEQGYGEKEDVENCEAKGKLEWADALTVSSHAKNRGRDQVGTLGSGNHFMELQKVEEIFDEEVAKTFGLFKDQIIIMIHCGSRGLGHQVCTDYLRVMIPAMQRYKIKVPDREFACVPFNSPEGQRYFSAMASAANYAWANRQMIAHYVRKAWNSVLGASTSSGLVVLYDVAHNIIKKEKYLIDGEEVEVAVHRKGATRAFPGQPVLIPGSMGTASYVLVGTEKGKEAWYSTCHGAGRRMSRHAAIRALSGQEVINQLKAKGILIKCYSMRGIAEEAPQAYKNIDEVVEVVHQAGLSKKVARLVPLAVIKGE